MDARTALARVFAGMTSPNDLPTALEEMEDRQTTGRIVVDLALSR